LTAAFKTVPSDDDDILSMDMADKKAYEEGFNRKHPTGDFWGWEMRKYASSHALKKRAKNMVKTLIWVGYRSFS
jgi:hypothetical protein